jgi:hypothetical protein
MSVISSNANLISMLVVSQGCLAISAAIFRSLLDDKMLALKLDLRSTKHEPTYLNSSG